jgi:GT2 family glycosyltransferase
MDLSIIIVSWNVRDILRANLNAIYNNNGDLDLEVFVVDNNSSDGSADMVRQAFPQARLISNNENLGFAKANNQAIREAKGNYVLLLNPDMRVKEDTLSNMVRWMQENPQASVAGCHLVEEKGETIRHVRRFPQLSDQLAIVLKLPHLFPRVLKDYIREDYDYSCASKIDSIRGGFFMIRQETIEKVGLLDERYFVWFEEVDYCKRVYKNLGEVWYTPVAECVDYVGKSFEQVPKIKTQKYFRGSMLKYFKKWHPVWQYWLLWIAWIFGFFIVWIMSLTGFKSKAKT